MQGRPLHRIDNPESIDIELINAELKAGRTVLVQYSDATYPDLHLTQLNALSQVNDDNFGIRFYGHYSTVFDCRVLQKLPDVKTLYIDCLAEAENQEIIKDLKHLVSLSLGIFDLKDPEILSGLNFKRLQSLILMETRSKSLNLEPIAGLMDLRYLTIVEHTKNIIQLHELPSLEYLCLNAVKKVSLSFVNNLKRLKTLELVLGSRDNFNEIEENEIEKLEIVRVRGFNDLTNIYKFKCLRSLVVQDLNKLVQLRFDERNSHLITLKIINCKSLNQLTGLKYLVNLEQLVISRTDNITFNSIIEAGLPASLTTFVFYTGNNNLDEEVKRRIIKSGWKTV